MSKYTKLPIVSLVVPFMADPFLQVAMLNLGPCSMLPPHYHPRASNYVVAVAGTTRTYMIEENGARVVNQTLTPGKMTIFPAASVHTMYNMGEQPVPFFFPKNFPFISWPLLSCLVGGGQSRSGSTVLLSYQRQAPLQHVGACSRIAACAIQASTKDFVTQSRNHTWKGKKAV